MPERYGEVHASHLGARDLTLIGMGSPNVVKVLLMLEECGLPYRLRRCDVILGEHRHADFAALSPNLKVPLLIDGATAIAESGAILMHLAGREKRFLPVDGAERSHAVQWLMFQMSAIGPVFGQVIHFSPGGAPDGYAKRRFANETRRLLEVLDTRLRASANLGGGDYGIADMATVPWLDTLERMLGPLPDTLTALAAWRAGIAARPASGRVAAITERLAEMDRESFARATREQLDRYFGRTGEPWPPAAG